MGIYLLQCETKKGEECIFQSHGRKYKVTQCDITHKCTTHLYPYTHSFDNFIKPMKYHPLLNSNDFKNNYIMLA